MFTTIENMKQKRRWKCHWLLIFIFQMAPSSALDGDVIHSRNAQKTLFSPRMDYNQWKPLGRGDPLKNDPTFDYVPPVLDHVHYWMDPEPQPHGEKGQKTEILLLGVSSKKPATNGGHSHVPNQPPLTANDRRDTVYAPYSKSFLENGPNHYNHYPNQRIARPNYFPSMTSQIIPSIMSLANKVFDRNKYFKDKESKIPYTVLMPPPEVTKIPDNINQYAEPLLTTPVPQKHVSFEPFTPSQPLPATVQLFSSTIPPKGSNQVTVQESNLIYQSSSLGNQKEFESVPSISWELPSTTESNRNNFMFNSNLSPPKSFIQIQFAPRNLTNKILEASDSNHNINYVTPPPLSDDQVTFKGIVSDDNERNSYEKIEKPEAQMNHMGIDLNNIHPVPVMSPHAEGFKASSNLSPISMQTIRDMETMKPPPVTQSPVYTRSTTPSTLTQNLIFSTSSNEGPDITRPLTPFSVTGSPTAFRPTNAVANILKKEHIQPDFHSSNLIGSSSSITNTFVTTPKPDNSLPVSTLPTISSETNEELTSYSELTTLPPPSAATIITTTEGVTTMQTLTTDPLFKHYRQPVEPMRGPLYLIIQGHSKVKTYKPAKQIDGIMVQETNEIPYLRNSKVDYSIKHLHGFHSKEDFLAKSESIAKQRQARTGNLQTLKHVVQTGLGAINFSREEEEMLRRRDVDLQETDLEVGYELVDSKEVTSEKYHKGIVEEARQLKTFTK